MINLINDRIRAGNLNHEIIQHSVFLVHDIHTGIGGFTHIIDLYRDLLGDPVCHHQADGAGVTALNRQSAGRHVAGEAVVVRQFHLAGTVNSGQVRNQRDITGIDLI